MSRDVQAERADIDRTVAGRTVCSLFADLARDHGDDVAIKWRDPEGWQQMTWREYRERVKALTVGLLNLGCGPGQFGVIMCRNRPEHVIADHAIVHTGAAGVSLYNTLAPEQVRYIVGHCEATIAFVEDLDFLARFEQVRDQLPKLEHIVLMEGEAAGTIAWTKLIADGEEAARRDPEAFDRSWSRITPGDLVSLIYTSGTTGPPKGVMYSHANVAWTLESRDRIIPFDGMRLISYLPLSHIAERFTSHWGPLTSRSVVYYLPDMAKLVPTMIEVKPQVFVGVPRVWEKFAAAIHAGVTQDTDPARRQAVEGVLAAGGQLFQAEQRGQTLPLELQAKREGIAPVQKAIQAKLGLEECAMAITSTAPISMDVHEFFGSIGLPLVEVWGMSELTGPSTVDPPGALRSGTVGVAFPGQELRLAEDGEILVRGGNVMVGYYKEPAKTAELIDAEGWVHTGDIATVDEDGYYTIVDRKKELIITAGGKNISPANLESLLKHHSLVGQACVIGDRRPYLVALIVLDPETAGAWARAHGIDATSLDTMATDPAMLAEIRKGVDWANQQVSRHEQVKRFKILPVEWTAQSEELTPTLKLKRRIVTEKYAGEIDALYALVAESA
jgi:long-subunit acyl-CoA synthetase (AMP-forming)